MSNILEEYLVRVGAEVDKDAFNGASQAINNLAGTISKLGSVLKYAGVFVAITKVTESVVDNIRAVAAADMEYQKLAQNMWVTKETAKSLSVVLKTMGASQEDVAWVPELREQFFRLRQEMNALATPADAGGQLSWIREIGYDVQSLQLKLKMLREWLVYYLIKYLQPYIKEFQEFIRWLNDKFGKNMPEIARKVASVLASIVRVAVSLLKALKWLFGGIYNFIDALPGKTKALVAVFAVAGAAIMAGPFGLMMMAIGTALILLEDFFGYLEGRESSKTLAPLWKWLTDENNPLKRLLGVAQEAISDILKNLTELLTNVFTDERREQIKEAVTEVAKGVSDIAGAIADIIAQMSGKNKGKVKSFWSFFADEVGHTIDTVLNLAKAVGKVLQAVGKAKNGDLISAGKMLLSAGDSIVDAFKSSPVGRAMGAVLGGDQKERAKYAVQKLMSLGWSKEQAAGIVGNLIQESGLNPESIGDGGTSGGIAQWHNERWEALKDFAAARGTDWTDYDTQLEYLDYELKHNERAAGDALRLSGTAEGSAQIFSDMFERPAAEAANNEGRRANAAEVYGYMDEYANGAPEAHSNDGAHGGGGGDYPVSPTSYAAAGLAPGGYVPYATNNSTYNGGVVNVGGIVVNCGSSSNPARIANAVSDNLQQRLAAVSGGGVLV